MCCVQVTIASLVQALLCGPLAALCSREPQNPKGFVSAQYPPESNSKFKGWGVGVVQGQICTEQGFWKEIPDQQEGEGCVQLRKGTSV